MKKTGAELVRYALEQIGVRYTFGIPGVHNTEIYDQLASSPSITPIRITHEGSAGFMADAVSRTNDYLGALLIVPAAGTALAAAGIGEAFLDGIPLLVISGGTRNDSDFRYQLHELDQLALVKPITKGAWRVATHQDIVPTIFEAARLATCGEPGPVFVEIPVNLQLFPGEVDALPTYQPSPNCSQPLDAAALERAAQLLAGAKRPGLFLGWGAADASELATQLAERLGAPVATTLQGLSRISGQPSAAHRHGDRAGGGAGGGERLCRMRRPARGRHPLRRNRHRQLRPETGLETDPYRHQPGRLQRQLPGRSHASKAMRAPCCKPCWSA